MLVGRVMFREGENWYALDIRGIDLSSAFQGVLETHTQSLINYVGATEGIGGLSMRRFDIKSGSVKVESTKYVAPNGKEKVNPVNDAFWCKFGALYSYAKKNCKAKHERGYTGIQLVSDDFLEEMESTFDIPFPDGSGILAEVVLRLGIVNSMKLKTDDFYIELESKEGEEVFSKINTGVNKGFKYNTETLGFEIPKQKVQTTSDTTELYGTLEEIMDAHPDKDFAWLRGKDYRIVTDETLEGIVQEFLDFDGKIYYDTETTGLNINFKSRLGQADGCVGIILSKEDGVSYYFPMQMETIKNLCDGDHEYFMQRYMKKILETKPIVAHNASFDWKVAYIYNIMPNIVDDTMLLYQLTIRAKDESFKCGLKELTSVLLKRDSLELDDISVTGKWHSNFKYMPEDLVRLYACADTDNTKGILDYADRHGLLQEYGADQTYRLELEFLIAVAYQEFYGQRIAVDRVPELRQGVELGMAVHQAVIFGITGKEFNIGSSQQLLSVGKDIGIEFPKKWSTGKPTTEAKEVDKLIYEDSEFVSNRTSALVKKLEGLAVDGVIDQKLADPLVKEYIEVAKNETHMNLFFYHLHTYRRSKNILNKFLSKLSSTVTPDGYTFPSVNQIGADTGRVSVSKPNYQSYDDVTKKHTIPTDGYYFIDSDYSSIEYRTLGSIVGNKGIMEGFKDPEFDYHQYQASRMFNVPYESVSKKLRKQSKSLNFGIPYGMGDASLGESVFGSRSQENTRQAKELRRKYFEGQEDIQNAFKTWQDDGEFRGYTCTYFGRRRYYDKNRQSRGYIRRQAGNHVIQGSAADIYKLAVVRVFKMICKEGWLDRVHINAFVHDEVLVEVHNSIDPAVFLAKFKKAYELEVEGFCPLYIGFGYGRSWYEAKSVELPIKLQAEIIEQYGETGFPDEIWGGDIDKFCDGIPDMIRLSNIRSVVDNITSPDSQGKVIKPATMAYLYDILKEDERLIDKAIKNGYDGSELEDYKTKYGLVELQEGLHGTGKMELQEALDVFCYIHGVDRGTVNLLHTQPIVEKEESNVCIEDTEEFYERERENLKWTRIKQLGVFMDTENDEVVFDFNPVMAQEIMKRSKDSGGYKIYFKDFSTGKLYVLEKYIDSRDILEVQNLYIAQKSMCV